MDEMDVSTFDSHGFSEFALKKTDQSCVTVNCQMFLNVEGCVQAFYVFDLTVIRCRG